MTRGAYNRLRKRVARAMGEQSPKTPRPRVAKADLAEQRFNHAILGGRGEFVGSRRAEHSIAVTMRGLRYTPDYLYTGESGRTVVCEVKLARYRSQLEGRLIKEASRVRWECAGDRHEEYDLAWGEYLKGGAWEIEVRRGGTTRSAKGVCFNRQGFESLLRRLDDGEVAHS